MQATSPGFTFQTPVPNVEPALGKGMREKRPAACLITPYKNPGSDTPPTRNLEEDRKRRKLEKAAYNKTKPRPTRESIVVQKYWDGLLQKTQIRHLTVEIDELWWSQLLGLDGKGWYEDSVSSAILLFDILVLYMYI